MEEKDSNRDPGGNPYQMRTRTLTYVLLASALMLFAAGCKKKTPAPPPPPPPPPKVEAPKPPPPKVGIGSFTAEPSSIQRGQSATLRWSTSNAESVTIEPGIGTVPANGSRQVYPNDTTNYTLRAAGSGGPVTSSARVTVTEPPPPPPTPVSKPVTPTETITQMLERLVQDVYFDYDKYDVREDARSQLTRNADGLKSLFQRFPSLVITVEGHCDERGSAEYNLGLGDRRSTSAKDFLVQLGVPADKLKNISYGKERPQCSEANEGCWQRNRRAHFAAQ